MGTTTTTTTATTSTTSVDTTPRIPIIRTTIKSMDNLTEYENDSKEIETLMETSNEEDSEPDTEEDPTESPIENIAGRRSDNVNLGAVFDGTDDSKVSRPEVEASTGHEESETDADHGWGSGSSKTSDITSKVLFFCLI